MSWLNWCAFVAVLCAAMASEGRAQTQQDKNLAGLRTVKVVIEHLDADETHAGIDSIRLRTTIELRLRQAGLRVVGQGNGALPFVYFKVAATESNTTPGLWFLGVNLELNEPVQLLRTKALGWAGTWTTSTTGLVGQNDLDETVEKASGRLLDQFVNAWLAANAK
jgi:hypothetical protein